MDDDAANVANLRDIIGVSDDVALGLLQITGGDVGQACTLYFDNPDVVNSFGNSYDHAGIPGQAAASSSTNVASAAASSSATRGREDDRGVIHLGSDDDDDIEMSGTPGGGFSGLPVGPGDDAAAAETVARSAQEDEDAALARKLQEEFYSGAEAGSGSDRGPGGAPLDVDEIRAPIASTMDTLVGPRARGPYLGDQLEADDDADAEAAIMAEMRRQRAAQRARSSNPFAQSVWEEGSPAHPSGGQSSTSRRLAELFRPPHDLITHLDWDDTREEGKAQKKWILVNLQDMTDFKCQSLNRDHWKDERIKELIRERFLFLQFDKADFSGQRYVMLYMPTEQHNINNYPHVAVVDPRTGEQMKVWSGADFPDVDAFYVQLLEFLERYKFNGKNPVATAKAPAAKKVVDVDRLTEDEMLQLAMQASLESNGASASSASKPSVVDPDELTKAAGKRKATDDSVDLTTSPPASSNGPGAAIEAPSTPDVGTPTAPQTQSSFAGIASNLPHEEPTNGPGITRIQFMHPGGRVVRRFHAQDSVSRVYEWLKAEPLVEGKEGVEFELKRMPQGKDLIEDLDKTIEEAGIKQSTLAVEFIEG